MVRLESEHVEDAPLHSGTPMRHLKDSYMLIRVIVTGHKIFAFQTVEKY